jgi:hypothetical protein
MEKSGEIPMNKLQQGPEMIRQGLIRPRAFTTEREARQNDMSTDEGRESMQFMATMERIFGA